MFNQIFGEEQGKKVVKLLSLSLVFFSLFLLVKIISDDDGEAIDKPVWHLSTDACSGNTVLCTGEVFGFGEGDAVYKTKEVERGGITCEHCLTSLKWFKSIKL